MNDNIVVVIISVVDWAEIQVEMQGIGIGNYLSKPILPSVLYSTIVELTGPAQVEKSDALSATPDWREKRILLVEDIEINREILIAILEETGVRIDCATNGMEGHRMFCDMSTAYDLILMDIQMPVMDGLEATRQIRQASVEKASSIPIVAMTANAFKEDVDACFEAGMNDHIAKPVEVERLFSVIHRYLR